jgi:hypothetical protein
MPVPNVDPNPFYERPIVARIFSSLLDDLPTVLDFMPLRL